jgi:hypothetical protein
MRTTSTILLFISLAITMALASVIPHTEHSGLSIVKQFHKREQVIDVESEEVNEAITA